MLEGLAYFSERAQFRVKSETASGLGDIHTDGGRIGTIMHGGSMVSWFDTAVGPAPGFVIEYGSSCSNATDDIPAAKSYQAHIKVGGVSWYDVGSSYKQNIELILELTNYSVYAHSTGRWYVTWDHAYAIQDGTIKADLGGGAILADTFICPNSIPIYSGCLQISYYCSYSCHDNTGAINSPWNLLPTSWSVNADGDGTFGFRYWIDGAWRTSSCVAPPSSDIVGGDSWSVKCHCDGHTVGTMSYVGKSACPSGAPESSRYDRWLRSEDYGNGEYGGTWLFSSPPRAIKRIGPDNESLVERFGSPRYYYYLENYDSRGRSDANYPGLNPTLHYETTQVYDLKPPILFTAGDTPHLAETEFFDRPTYMFAHSVKVHGQEDVIFLQYAGSTHYDSHSPGCSLDPYHDNGWTAWDMYTYPSGQDAPLPFGQFNAQLAGNLYGWEEWGGYHNTIANPHWSFFLWAPPDSTGGGGSGGGGGGGGTDPGGGGSTPGGGGGLAGA